MVNWIHKFINDSEVAARAFRVNERIWKKQSEKFKESLEKLSTQDLLDLINKITPHTSAHDDFEIKKLGYYRGDVDMWFWYKVTIKDENLIAIYGDTYSMLDASDGLLMYVYIKCIESWVNVDSFEGNNGSDGSIERVKEFLSKK